MIRKGLKHPSRKRESFYNKNKWEVEPAPFVVDSRKKRPLRVQPIWSLNRAVTNGSDNPVRGTNTRPASLKTDGDPPGSAWQIALDWRAVWLPANFQLSDNVDSMIKDSRINNMSPLSKRLGQDCSRKHLTIPPRKSWELYWKGLITKATIYHHLCSYSLEFLLEKAAGAWIGTQSRKAELVPARKRQKSQKLSCPSSGLLANALDRETVQEGMPLKTNNKQINSVRLCRHGNLVFRHNFSFISTQAASKAFFFTMFADDKRRIH